MSLDKFVIIVLCQRATLDDLMHERQWHNAIAVDIIQHRADMNYLQYAEEQYAHTRQDIKLMFIFGKNDSMIVKNAADMETLRQRLKNNDC